MANDFSHYLPIEKQLFDEVWASGTLWLDTCILLRVYQIPEASAEELLRILELPQISTRLQFAHQVAKEFHAKREAVIRRPFVQAHNSVVDLCTGLQKCHELSAQARQFSSLRDDSVPTALSDLAAQLEKLKVALVEAADHRYASDSICFRLSALMRERTCDPPERGDFEKWRDIANGYLGSDVPFPGRRDILSNKKEKASCGGFGDFYIWQEMIGHAKQHAKHGILVTDDLKDGDWCIKEDHDRVKLHPENRRRYREEVPGKELMLVTFGEFTDWATRTFPTNEESAAALRDCSADAPYVLEEDEYEYDPTTPPFQLEPSALARMFALSALYSPFIERERRVVDSAGIEKLLPYLRTIQRDQEAIQKAQETILRGLDGRKS